MAPARSPRIAAPRRRGRISPRGRPARRGVTLVEVAIFTAVGLLVMAAAWTFFAGSAEIGRSTDTKLTSLQTNLLLARALERDLAALHEDESHPLVFEKVPGEQARLDFYRYAPYSANLEWDPPVVERVVYRFDASTKRVTRESGGLAQTLFGLFERVNFRFAAPRVPEDGEPFPSSPTILFSSVSAPRETLRKPLEERDFRNRTTLVGACLRERTAARTAYPYWNEIPYKPDPPPAP